jgi:hypothetical protein
MPAAEDNLSNGRASELKAEELALRRDELALRRDELEARKADENRWFSSPLTVAVWGLVASLLVTGAGAFFQSRSNSRLETRRAESSLIQNALSAEDKRQAKSNVLFLVKAGLVQENGTIESFINDPKQVAFFGGAALRDGLITVKRAKELLQACGFYQDPPDDEDNPAFRQALAKFQMKRGMAPDGLLGPHTLQELWWTTPEFGPKPKQAGGTDTKTTSFCDS